VREEVVGGVSQGGGALAVDDDGDRCRLPVLHLRGLVAGDWGCPRRRLDQNENVF